MAEERAATPLTPVGADGDPSSVATDTAAADESNGDSIPARLTAIEEGDHDSGTETLQDSDDSDHDDQIDPSSHQDLIGGLVGWNVSI